MGEGVVHGVRAHRTQLGIPHTVLFGEQEGDKLPRNTWGRRKAESLPQLTGCSVSNGVGKAGSEGNKVAPLRQTGSWEPSRVLTAEVKGSLTSSRKKYGSSISRKGSWRKSSMNSCTWSRSTAHSS